MWKKKKPKADPQIQIHQLEIDKIKLNKEIKKHKNSGVVGICVSLLMLLALFVILI